MTNIKNNSRLSKNVRKKNYSDFYEALKAKIKTPEEIAQETREFKQTNKLIVLLQQREPMEQIILFISRNLDRLYSELFVIEKDQNLPFIKKFFDAYLAYSQQFKHIPWIFGFFFIQQLATFHIRDFYQNIIGRVAFYGNRHYVNSEYNFIYPGEKLNQAIALDQEKIQATICDYIYVYDIFIKEIYTYAPQSIKLMVYKESQHYPRGNDLYTEEQAEISKNFFEYTMHYKPGYIQEDYIIALTIEKYKKWFQENYKEELYELM